MTTKNIPQFLIAAPMSGSGKTTICRGLIEVFSEEGLRVQPFKCGPDYIDTKFHELACGQPSINLDSFMASESHVSDLYQQYASQADVAVVEGMMGMFDGYDRAKGSSADIARILHIPVVLVVNAKASAYSTAALISGFRNFNPEVRVIGVIFNQVAGDKHAAMLREVCDDLQLHFFGAMRKNSDLNVDSRYLGLDFSRNPDKKDCEWLSTFSKAVRRDILWEELLEQTTLSLPTESLSTQVVVEKSATPLHIAVARNAEAFSFVYAEHLSSLTALGKVSFFDPQTNTTLPEAIDLLYLPGGYPEKHAEELSNNSSLRNQIKDYIEKGGKVLAECGGMIYLSKGIRTETDFYPMVGAFPFTIDHTPAGKKLTIGYRQFDYQGVHFRGHEFHFTQISKEDTSLLKSITTVCNAAGEPVDTSVFRYKNAIASYTHLYWGENDLLKIF